MVYTFSAIDPIAQSMHSGNRVRRCRRTVAFPHIWHGL